MVEAGDINLGIGGISSPEMGKVTHERSVGKEEMMCKLEKTSGLIESWDTSPHRGWGYEKDPVKETEKE